MAALTRIFHHEAGIIAARNLSDDDVSHYPRSGETMLYRHSADMSTQHNTRMRDGKGTVTVKHLLDPGEMFGKGRLFAELTVPPGASIGLHRHEGTVEAYYFLEGKGRYQDNDQFYEVAAGDLTLVDDNDSHGVENTGDTPLKLIGLVLFTDGKP
ncbi:MAG: cupin domain-containing protein [Candidatus Accumulibacter sp.]|nr:cupin domain-containing protein [Accumulibacter sp.]